MMKKIYTLNEKSNLRNISNTNVASSGMASAIVALVDGTGKIYRPLDLPNTLGKKASMTAENKNLKEHLLLYPNPAENYVKVSYLLPENTKTAHIELFDINGKKIHSQNISNEKGILEINISNINSGTYFVKLSNGKSVISTRKLIINK